MPEYMLFVTHDGPYPDMESEEAQAMFKAVGEFNVKLQEGGKWVFAGGLQPRETATTIDPRSGDLIVTDGPFSEAKEYVGGFWVIKANDRDEALQLAREGARACGAVVEVRQLDMAPSE